MAAPIVIPKLSLNLHQFTSLQQAAPRQTATGSKLCSQPRNLKAARSSASRTRRTPHTIDQLTVTKVSKTYQLLRRLCILLSAFAVIALVWTVHATSRTCSTAITIVAVVFVAYSASRLPILDNRTDNELYVPTSLSLLSEGNLELSEYGETNLVLSKRYRIFKTNGEVFLRYPMGTAIATAPLVAVGYYAFGGEQSAAWRRLKTASFVANVLAALSVGLLFLVLIELGSSSRTAVILALLFAFASPHWPTHGGGLWSSNLSTLLLLLTSFVLLRREGQHAWITALPLGLAVATRPTAVLFVPIAGLFLLRWHRKQLLVWIGLMASSIATLVLTTKGIYGLYQPPYYGTHLEMLSLRRFSRAFTGLLFSPNRGLFVFCPLFLVSIWGGVLSLWRAPGRTTDFLRLTALYCLGYILFMSTFRVWWGGGSYGPRLLAELFPFLTILLWPCLERVKSMARSRRHLALAMLVLFAGFGSFAAYRGVTEPATRSWNRWPKRIDKSTHRLWDWSDMQIFRTTSGRPQGRRPVSGAKR